MFVVLLLIWVVLLCLHYYYNRIDLITKGSKLPSPSGSYPIVGHSLLFLGKPEKIFKLMTQFKNDSKRMIALWLGPWLNVFVFDPRDVEVMLKASRQMNKAYQYKFLRPWLGDSILLSSGAKFRQNKKILVQTFHINNLKEYLKIFNEQAQVLIENLQAEVGKGEFDVHGYLNRSTMHTLLETSLGVDKETMSPADSLNYAKAVEEVERTIHMRTYKVWLYPDILFRYSSLKQEQDKHIDTLNQLTNRVIAKRKTEYEARKGQQDETGEKSKSRNKFLDNFFEARKENGEAFTDEEIKDEVMTMMFAGQDTTTATMGFALSLLGIFHDVQDKVIKELDGIYGESDRAVTYDDIQKMKYLEQVIQETWRLYPPIPAVARTSTEDVHLDGYVIPKNCTVAVTIMMLHRNPEQFPNPDRFNPDNFLPEKIKLRHPYSFVPFSANYRACIGSKYAMLVIKVFLSTILRNYRVTSKRKMRDFVLSAQTVLKRKDGFLINLEERKNFPCIM